MESSGTHSRDGHAPIGFAYILGGMEGALPAVQVENPVCVCCGAKADLVLVNSRQIFREVQLCGECWANAGLPGSPWRGTTAVQCPWCQHIYGIQEVHDEFFSKMPPGESTVPPFLCAHCQKESMFMFSGAECGKPGSSSFFLERIAND